MKKAYLKNSQTKRVQSGFTLLEILVALALGIGILTAAISLQFQHRKGFKQSANKLTMQTNAKFAFELIGQSLRSAGSMGCKNGISLRGEAMNLRSENCFGNVCSAFNSGFDVGNVAFADFRPGFEIQGYEFTGAGMVPAISQQFLFATMGLNNDNSDVISISGGYGEVYKIIEDDVALLPGSTGVSIDMTDLNRIRLKQFQYGILSSCEAAYVFKITSTDADLKLGVIKWEGGNGELDDNANGLIGEKAARLIGSKGREMRRAAVVTYFVGDNDNGVPVLYQDVDGVSSRLVDGVEEIQILYGLSTNDNYTNVADRYLNAEEISKAIADPDFPVDWDDIVSVRIGLIMRSLEYVYDTAQSPAITLSCVGYSQTPVKSDKYSRSTYCADISLRNRFTGARIAKREK